MQKLSERLQAVSDFVTPGNRVADIGTDHAYLPIYLIQSGRCPGAVAMDIRKGPLERAEEHIAAAGLKSCIKTRLSDGLQNLEPGEADSVVIAGMGGLTVIKILEASADLLPHIRELVLEPQSDIAKVRRFLREHNMYTDRENLVLEDGKYYPVLHVVMERPCQAHTAEFDTKYMEMALKEKIPEQERLCQVLDQYGEYLVYTRHPVLWQLLERDEKVKRDILYSLGRSAHAENAARRQELERQVAEICILREIQFLNTGMGGQKNEMCGSDSDSPAAGSRIVCM